MLWENLSQKTSCVAPKEGQTMFTSAASPTPTKSLRQSLTLPLPMRFYALSPSWTSRENTGSWRTEMNITPFLNPELAIVSLSSSLKIIFISVCLYGRGHSHECITAARRCPLGSLTVPIYFWKASRDERELPSPGQSVSIRTVEGQVSSSSPGLGTNTCLCCSLSQQGHKNANPSLSGAPWPLNTLAHT